MDALVQFNLPVSGLKDGLHSFDFQIDDTFFACFEASVIKEGAIKVQVVFDKRPDMYVLSIAFDGVIRTECDRCLDDFMLPIAGRQSLLFKFDEAAEEDADIVFIARGEPQLNIAQYIYEYIHLSVPIAKTHDLASETCDEAVLKILNRQNTDKDSGDDENPVWDALKGLKK